MFDVGRICIKIAGRDAGRKCVIVSIKDGVALVDGQTRRRKCNVRHLEPLKETLDIKADAAHDAVVAAFKKIDVECRESKPKKATERPRKVRKKKEYPVEEKPAAKPAAKPKTEKPAETKAAAPAKSEKPAPKAKPATPAKTAAKAAPKK